MAEKDARRDGEEMARRERRVDTASGIPTE